MLSPFTTTDRIGWFGRPATGGQISYRLVLLLTMAGGAPVVLLKRIFAAVRDFCQHADPSDDMTVTVTCFR
jgi:hypothetical protein